MQNIDKKNNYLNQNNEYPLQYIKGVGPKRAEILFKECLKRPLDLLFYFPTSYIDKNSSLKITQIEELLKKRNYIFDKDHDNLTSEFNVKRHYSIIARIVDKREVTLGRGRKLLTLIIDDGSKKTAKINFWSRADWFKKLFRLGQNILVSGEPTLKSYQLEFAHPDIDIIEDDDLSKYQQGKILPKYRITQKMSDNYISVKIIRSIVEQVINKEIDKINEFIPEYVIKNNDLLSYKDAVKNLHFPESIEELEKSKVRMKFNDVFWFLLKTRSSLNNSSYDAISIEGKSKLSRKVYDSLPYQLTNDQKKVLGEIASDIKKSSPMKRLLQGDVGSGKTIVALLSLLMAVDKGYQALFIAPTQVLAEQHLINFQKLCHGLDIDICLLVGSMKAKNKKEILDKVSSGETKIIIGTHALFQSKVSYNNLAFIVIDEQHKFGVAQRAKLNELASNSIGPALKPHVLVMSATPIPRTLSMTLYANMDLSLIKQKPSGRTPIITSISFESRLGSVYDFIKKEIANGRQAYIVFPLIEKSEKIDLKSAQESFELLSNTVFRGIECELLHGKIKAEEKEAIMQKFSSGNCKILFSTTVIEVGIDVPNANIMLIMNSERFGLSQLHQLRGRVGRGKYQSYCILATKDHYQFLIGRKKANENDKISAIFRLKTMERTNDGFEIAEEDLKLRGPGDMTSEKQSGLPNFRFLDLINDLDLIIHVRAQVDDILSQDPFLEKEENKLIKTSLTKLIQNEDNYFDIA